MVRLIAYNIEYGEGNTTGSWNYFNPFKLLRPPEDIPRKIGEALNSYDPDILGLVEVDTGSARTHHSDEAKIIASKTGLDVDIEAKRYEGSGLQWLIRQLPYMSDMSNAVLSGLPIQDQAVHTFHRGVKNIAIEIVFEQPHFALLLVHLALGKRARRRQLEQIASRTQDIEEPLIVCGDFNTFHLEELKPLLEKTSLRDSHLGRTISFTHPTWEPKYQVDNVLTSPDITVEKYDVIEESFSDHLPVLVDFSLDA